MCSPTYTGHNGLTSSPLPSDRLGGKRTFIQLKVRLVSIPICKALRECSERLYDGTGPVFIRYRLAYNLCVRRLLRACARIDSRVGGGFVRSWKLSLRLTTRAEDSHATPDLNIAHPHTLYCALHTVPPVCEWLAAL
jgi:hypothetical protein